jgi:hypothetical protein
MATSVRLQQGSPTFVVLKYLVAQLLLYFCSSTFVVLHDERESQGEHDRSDYRKGGGMAVNS